MDLVGGRMLEGCFESSNATPSKYICKAETNEDGGVPFLLLAAVSLLGITLA